jgi:predicted HAD superfamily hydrolase
MSKLRKENQKLLIENKETKATVHSNIAHLQKQMTEALTIALSKKTTLEAKLKEAENYILELESSRENNGSATN